MKLPTILLFLFLFVSPTILGPSRKGAPRKDGKKTGKTLENMKTSKLFWEIIITCLCFRIKFLNILIKKSPLILFLVINSNIVVRNEIITRFRYLWVMSAKTLQIFFLQFGCTVGFLFLFNHNFLINALGV